MSARKTVHQVWHVSHGIVFAGGTSVVYPRLPLPRHLSTPAAVASEKGSDSLPADFQTGEAHEELATNRELGNAQDHAVATSTTTRIIATTDASAISTAATSAIAIDGVTEGGRGTAAGLNVAPFTPLDFKIPDRAFRDASRAPEGSSKSYWTYSMYRGTGEGNAADAKVKVHYCTSSHTTERVLQQYFMNDKVLGFDLEWASNALKHWGARHNVSLVQLASPSRIGLFHLAAFPKQDNLVAPSLKRLMEDPGITKVGVWIKGDCKRLSNFLGIQTRGQFELSHLYKLVKYSKSGEPELINKKVVALATQVKECLGLPMFKGSDVRTSDWTRPLNMPQIIYSASDAYAAVQIYAVLNHARQKLDPTPPLPHHAELDLPIRIADRVLPTETKAPDVEPEVIVEDEPGPHETHALQNKLILKHKPILVDCPVHLDLPDASITLEPERDLSDQPTSVP